MLFIGRMFAVIGAWDETPCPDDRLPIYLHPGRAHGHGWHESTKRMLRQMEAIDFHGKTVLDIGTGCGTLAIAAHRLGATVVHATEKEPRALAEAEANFETNGLPSLLTLTDQVSDGSWDIALCNLGDEFWVAAQLEGRAEQIIYSTKTGEVWLSDRK